VVYLVSGVDYRNISQSLFNIYMSSWLAFSTLNYSSLNNRILENLILFRLSHLLWHLYLPTALYLFSKTHSLLQVMLLICWFLDWTTHFCILIKIYITFGGDLPWYIIWLIIIIQSQIKDRSSDGNNFPFIRSKE